MTRARKEGHRYHMLMSCPLLGWAQVRGKDECSQKVKLGQKLGHRKDFGSWVGTEGIGTELGNSDDRQELMRRVCRHNQS